MTRVLLLVTLVMLGCNRQPAAVVYMDPLYDYAGGAQPPDSRRTLDRVFGGVSFAAPAPARIEPVPEDLLRAAQAGPPVILPTPCVQ